IVDGVYLSEFYRMAWEALAPQRFLGMFCNYPVGKQLLASLRSLLDTLTSPIPALKLDRPQGQLWELWQELAASLDVARDDSANASVEILERAAAAASSFADRSIKMLLEGSDELLAGPLGREARGFTTLGKPRF